MKKFFQNRSLRERLLLLAFCLIGLAWWAPVALRRLGTFRQEFTKYRSDYETQQLWLSHRTEIETHAAAVARTLEPTKMLDASQAFNELNRMTSGLTPEIVSGKTLQSDQFALNNIQVTIRKADIASLVNFYTQLAARAPYLGIEGCVLSADRASPGMINAVFRVYSIEALPPSK
jgi:HAMP domain-containing protein